MISVPLTILLADGPRQTGPDFGKASPAGLVITLILLIAVVALVWSMNRHLRKLPESFDPAHPEPDQAVDDGTVGGVPHEASAGDAGPDGTTKPETG
ncbi:hypothetical protein [Mycolicibacterium sp. CBMA 226]|uniref:hypothetical protein n=1 Tax=Mycolicibacterium sp. CBMA 226 TaxID=2606611 RepID=UPI00130C035A|nr:hypothetical protein [Mycolicibacterium sp. CBMA 226]MUL78014.1 hypothetical protein [Mycolicibacterium sp. CBMA 226]